MGLFPTKSTREYITFNSVFEWGRSNSVLWLNIKPEKAACGTFIQFDDVLCVQSGDIDAKPNLPLSSLMVASWPCEADFKSDWLQNQSRC